MNLFSSKFSPNLTQIANRMLPISKDWLIFIATRVDMAIQMFVIYTRTATLVPYAYYFLKNHNKQMWDLRWKINFSYHSRA